MKENYQIYLAYQFYWRPHWVDQEPQFLHKKMKAMFLKYVKKSKTDLNFFFPISQWAELHNLIAH